MQRTFALTILAILLPAYSFANGGPKMTDVDYEYGDKLKSKESAPDRTKMTRQKMEENPRNRGFSDSFGQIGKEGIDQDRTKEKKRSKKSKLF